MHVQDRRKKTVTCLGAMQSFSTTYHRLVSGRPTENVFRLLFSTWCGMDLGANSFCGGFKNQCEANVRMTVAVSYVDWYKFQRSQAPKHVY